MTARFELSRIAVWCLGIFLLLTGVLPGGALAGITPATHDFGNRDVLGDPASVVFTISNSGSSTVAVISTALTGSEAADYSVVQHTCQQPILAGGSCTVEVAFVPRAAGTRTAQLEVATDDSVNPLLTASLVGTGIMQRYRLSLSILGDGYGTVHSSPGTDMACSSGTCSEYYDKGTTVTLTPSTPSASLFAGWSGCNSVINRVCTVSITAAKYVTATFNSDSTLLNYRWEGGGPDGGVVNSLVLSPAYDSDSTLFAGTAGGVFKSVNSGTTWTAVNSGLSGLDVRGMAISPAYASDMTLFAATSAGLFASSDAGGSWISSGNGIAGLDLSSIAISPAFASDRTVYAGTNLGVYRSTDAGATWVPASTGLLNLTVKAVAVATDNTLLAATAGGVFASNNGGVTWNQLGSALANVNIPSISLSPAFASDGTVYAGTDNGAIYRYDTGLGDWVSVTPVGSSQPVISLTVSSGYPTDRTVVAGTKNGVYITTNAGSSWTQRNVVNWGSRSFGAVALSPRYGVDRTIYVGSQGGGVQFSNDGGAFWFSKSSGLTAVQVRSIEFSPDYAGDHTAFATALGGIYRTVDRGASWANITAGIDYVDVRALAVSPVYPIDRTLFAGSDGGVYRSSDSGASWTNIKAGIMVSAVALSPAYATDRTVYAAASAAEVYRSQDGGGSWEPVNSGMEGRIIYSLAFTPNGILFAGTDSGVYRLVNTVNGLVWQPVTAGMVAGGDKAVIALAASPGFATDNVLYAGTNGYGVLAQGLNVSSPDVWEALNTDLTNLNVQSLALAPDFPDSRTLFVATAGGGLFRSTSAGAQWVPYNNNLFNHDLLSVAVSPVYTMDRQLFAGSNGSGISRLIITEPQIVVTPPAINFGTVALSQSSGNRTITLANTGQVDLRVSSVSLSGADSVDFHLRPGSCPAILPFTLLPGETCTLSASFDPRISIGAKTATVTVESASTAQPLINLSLFGNAYDPPPFGSIAINNNDVVTVIPDVWLQLNAMDNSGVVASMRFSNDNAAWSEWAMYAAEFPWILSTIGGDGQKTVYVQYMDGKGNISESFQSSIMLDSTPPVTTITSMPATNYNDPSGTFEFVCSKPSSTFTCQIGSGTVVNCTSPFSFTGLGDGAYTVSIIARDPVGNIGPAATYNWTIDTVPPDTTITTTLPALTNSTAAEFTFSATETTTFLCRFDTGPWAPCPTPYALTDVPDGSHTLSVKARDAAGNTDQTPAVFSWTVDTVPPLTTIINKPSNPTNAVSGSITFTANESVSNYDCTLDGVEIPGCSSPFILVSLVEGLHTFTVRSRDITGNSEAVAASYGWRVDLTPPSTAIQVKPPVLSSLNSATFTFASTETGSTYECSLDAAPFATCATPLTLSALADGPHQLVTRAVDPAGNPDPVTARYDWTVDTTAPDTFITSAPQDPSTIIASTFAFTAYETGSTFQCRMDGGLWGACDSGIIYNALPNGAHSFMVRAIDVAGNVDQTPAIYSWTVNFVPAPQSVKVVGSGQPAAFYSAISDALLSYPAGTNPLVMLKASDFLENVVMNRCGETVTLGGGYNEDFTQRNGMTPIYGSLTVVCGALIVDSVEIR